MDAPRASPRLTGLFCALEPRGDSPAWVGGTVLTLSPSLPQPSARSSPHSPWSAGSSWTSRRSSWNSIGRAPSLKRRGQSGERRSLLSGEGKESSEDGESSDEERSSRAGSFNGSLPHRMESLETKGSFDLQDTLQVPSLYRTSSMHSSRTSASEHQDCNGKTSPGLLVHQLHLDDPRQDCDDGDDEGNMVRKCQVLTFGFFLLDQVLSAPVSGARWWVQSHGHCKRWVSPPAQAEGHQQSTRSIRAVDAARRRAGVMLSVSVPYQMALDGDIRFQEKAWIKCYCSSTCPHRGSMCPHPCRNLICVDVALRDTV